MASKKKNYDLLIAAALALSLSGLLHFFVKEASQTGEDKKNLLIVLENVSHRWNDLFYDHQRKTSPSADVVVLAIDEPSIIEIGRWPWSRSIINEITEKLLKYDVRTMAYDIIFSEHENSQADLSFARTIEKGQDQLIFGTFSDDLVRAFPYQDYCLTQAFIYTGGTELAKINPFFSVEDEANRFEEIPFNQLFLPAFRAVENAAEERYLKNYDATDIKQLTRFQLNTLNFYKNQQIHDYCRRWLTDADVYDINKIPGVREKYLEVFNLQTDEQLDSTITDLKTQTGPNPIPQYIMWRQNISEIQQKALYTASFVAHPDPDGIIRNYPLVFRTGNQLGTSYIPALALQSYLTATGYQAIFKIDRLRKSARVSSVEIKDISSEPEKTVAQIPVNSAGQMLVNYYGKQNTVYYVSAKEILTGSNRLEYFVRHHTSGSQYTVEKKSAVKTDFLKNKNIIFGATAVGIYDIRTTPNDINYPGPEIHASVLSNLLQSDFLAYSHLEPTFVFGVSLIFIFLSALIYLKTVARWGAVIFILQLLTLILLQKYLYRQGFLLHSTLLLIVFLFLTFLAVFIYKYFFQSKKSKEIKQAFSKYVSKDVVEEILKNESAIELRGQKLNMSVYFSDIRGFTEFSERMDPVELSELLNRYFTPMSAIITEHRGTIDKYIGDAIMAMFGAPINYANHAEQACRAALKCVNALDSINAEFEKKQWPKIDIGIGINSGAMNAGNIGSETIQNYTVIGDSVNLASRLEGLNKQYKTRIIISEFTYAQVKDLFNCRLLDTVQVKGKKEPVKIYELVS